MAAFFVNCRFTLIFFMKNAFFSFLLLICVHVVHAQPTFGFHANGIASTTEQEGDEMEEFPGVEPKSRYSWKIGVTAMVPLTESISFMPQLNVLSKGNKYDESGSENIFGETFSYDIKATTKLSYLELPLNFVYNHTLTSGSLFIGAGPSISYGLGGDIDLKYTITIDNETDSGSESANVKFDGKKSDEADDDNYHLKALEIGGNFIAGYRFNNGLFIQGTYNLGLNDIDPNDNSKVKNRYFGIGIGYFLPRR